jgi:hypothetical protein
VLLREDGDAVIVIGQASHAWLAGQLARSWGNDRFDRPEPFEEVCLAATQHDIGMSEWDLRPTLNPDTGRPHSFREMPLATHLELWTAAPHKLISQSTYAALLVSMHGTALYAKRNLDGRPAVESDSIRAYLEGQRALQRGLTKRLGTDAAELAVNQRLLAAWDHVSLAICHGWTETTIPAVPAPKGRVDLILARSGDRFHLDPWPFATPTLTLRAEGRRLTGRAADLDTLRDALVAAPVERLAFTLQDSGRSRSRGPGHHV